MYTRESLVAIRPFSRQPDGEEVVIGSLETGTFLAVPPEAVELLDELASGKTVGEVADLHREANGETPNLAEFLDFLETKGLVGPYGSATSASEVPKNPLREPKYHFSGFPQSLARLLFSRPVLACDGLLIAFAIFLISRFHSLLPVPTDMVFADHRALSLTILAVAGYAGVFLHELSHLVAARATGVNSRMGISHRLWFLVAETDMTGLWSVARRQRYMPMLAGMLFDAVFTSLLVCALFAQSEHVFSLSGFAIHLLRAIAFTNLMRIVWEFFLFTRTDVYFVAATFLNCKNLLNDTHVFLRNQLARLTSFVSPVDQSAIPLTERRAIKLYSGLFLAGRAWAFMTLPFVTIPVFLGYWHSLAGAFRAGYSANPANFLDTVAAASYFLIPTVTGFVFWGRALTRRKGA